MRLLNVLPVCVVPWPLTGHQDACGPCPSGDLGEAVAGAVSEESGIAVEMMAVREVPRSSKGAVTVQG